MKNILDAYKTKFPRSIGPQKVALKYLRGDLFKEEFESRLQKCLDKGVPGLVADLKIIYKA